MFGGVPREQSFEELRTRHYELAAQGNQQQAIQEAQSLVNNAEQQMQAVLNDVDGAIKYVIDGESQHPNRLDITNAKGVSTASGQPSAPSSFARPPAPLFNQPSASTSNSGQPSSFGQPATLGRPTTNFGQPSSSFGQSSLPTPAFGQPAFGAAPQNTPSPFGAKSGPSATSQVIATTSSPNTFGQPSAPQQPGLFNQPSAPTQPSSFGQAPAPSQTGVFGRPTAPSSFGQTTASAGTAQTSATPPNPFGRQAAPSTTGAFGHPSRAALSSIAQNGKLRISYASQVVLTFGT